MIRCQVSGNRFQVSRYTFAKSLIARVAHTFAKVYKPDNQLLLEYVM